MYKYEFVRVDLKTGLLKRKPKEHYRDIIDYYANEGWRFVQVFAPAISGYGSATYYELIFEKEV